MTAVCLEFVSVGHCDHVVLSKETSISDVVKSVSLFDRTLLLVVMSQDALEIDFDASKWAYKAEGACNVVVEYVGKNKLCVRQTLISYQQQRSLVRC